MKKYFIISEPEEFADFADVLQNSLDGSRINADATKMIVSTENDIPESLSGYTAYSHDEILVELEKEEWKRELG